jgi:hypothetical protein
MCPTDVCLRRKILAACPHPVNISQQAFPGQQCARCLVYFTALYQLYLHRDHVAFFSVVTFLVLAGAWIIYLRFLININLVKQLRVI